MSRTAPKPTSEGGRPPRLKQSEAQVQHAILETWALINNGLPTPYVVLSTSRQACNYTRAGGAGVTPGVPDLLFSNPCWPPGILHGMECKTHETGSKPTVEQSRLIKIGAYAVVREPYDSVEDMLAFEIARNWLGWRERCAALRTWLAANVRGGGWR